MKDTTHLLQIVQSSPDEMEERIVNRLRAEFRSIKAEMQPKQPTEFLTRSEVRDLLKIDLSSVHNWTKKGKLKAYGISGRIYYKRSEVEQALQPLNF